MLYKGEGIYDIKQEVYKMLPQTIAETNLREEEGEWIVWLFDGKIEVSDPTRDLHLVVFAPQIYSFWELLANKVVGTVQYEPLKQSLSNALKDERSGGYNLTIDEVKAKEIEASLPDGQSEEGQWAREEFAQTIEGLDVVDNSRANLMEAVENSVHKVFYDYVATLSTKDGVLLKDSAELLSEELGRLRRMEALMINSIDKKISELPMVKAEMHKSLLIPPGIVRGIATGSPVRHLMMICRAADRVGNYFLKTLNNEDPFGTSSFFVEAIAGKRLGSSPGEAQESAKQPVATSNPMATINMMKSASSTANSQESNNNSNQNQPPDV